MLAAGQMSFNHIEASGALIIEFGTLYFVDVVDGSWLAHKLLIIRLRLGGMWLAFGHDLAGVE